MALKLNLKTAILIMAVLLALVALSPALVLYFIVDRICSAVENIKNPQPKESNFLSGALKILKSKKI